ncbi:hypothetical protein [Methanosarcina sp.]|uniref:hypothetical protein n=1 Tax=Methanosarcina sp. TaxID=2213 RepID=UPI003BB5B551
METSHSFGSACNNHISVHVSVSVVRKMVPADHVRERVDAMVLRIECVMALKKSPVGKRNRFEIFLTQHYVSPQSPKIKCTETTI